MDGLIDGLLSYARAGRMKQEPAPVDVERLVETVIEDLGPLGGITVEAVTALPVLISDPISLTQVFQNLIGNAVKHHPGPTGRIEVSCSDSGQSWEFSVTDDGGGIPSRHHDRIFQIFEKLSPDDDVDSTGIGLSITKKIVESAGGTIWVESEDSPEKGSVFRFTWPKKGGVRE